MARTTPGTASGTVASVSSSPRPGRRCAEQPGDRRPEDDVDPGGEHRVAHRVPHEVRRADEDLAVVVEREPGRQVGERPHLGEREHDDAGVGEQRGAEQERPRAPRRHARAPGRRRGAPLRPAGERGPLAAAQQRLGPPQRQQGDGDQDHADHVAVDVVHPDRRHAQVGLGRQQLGVVQHQRGAEVVDDADEGRAGRRPRSRAAPAAGSRARTAARPWQPSDLGGLLGGGVDAGQRGRGVDEDEREVVERLHEDDARQALHEGHRRRRPGRAGPGSPPRCGRAPAGRPPRPRTAG